MTGPQPTGHAQAKALALAHPWSLPLRLSDHHAWLVLAASCDLMFTWLILGLGGREVNLLADMVLQTRGFPGLIMFKFALVLLVVICCEQVARQHPLKGRRLAIVGILISFTPVVWSSMLLVNYIR